ncbi:MAG: type II toxin-antitoxin system RelE family toxin [Candidatus Muiribacteriota bacterium]
MNLKIIPTPEFKKQVKKLSKQYKNIADDLKRLQELLTDEPEAGISLGNKCYKLRIANSSIPTGKSGGFRVITYYIDDNNTIWLLLIYSKTEKETVTNKEIQAVIDANDFG